MTPASNTAAGRSATRRGRRALLCVAAVFLALQGAAARAQDGWEPLFDGVSLAGWSTVAGDAEWWSVASGALTGGSLAREVPHNTFLSTTESFDNFELVLELRVRGTVGFVNSGLQVRSARVQGSSEMSGYQVDAGDGWWGKLYDESRRDRVLAEAADLEAVRAAVRPGDWNEFRIRAEGPRLRSWINGVAALDYSEPDPDIPLDGRIGIQVHGGGKALVQVRGVRLLRLPPTPEAMTWARLESQQAARQGRALVRSAAEERACFRLAEGFEVELVASEPDIQKVVDIAFDDRARLWAITAVEYPIDGNESSAAAELYARGGRDQVLVFDDIWGPGPHVPRVFADGLAIPLALLPEGDAVYVGQGPQILRLSDDDGDGRADRREVVLDGFGIEDSHLMPHRFVRAPGGWIYLAQGAFNSSRVRTTGGEVVPFDRCKLGRFRRDGSRFETVGVGLNNIWGFVLDRRGDKWIQEANDLGYSLVPFEHGASYPGIGEERYRPWSPWQPPVAEFRMGGTGLSGLALSQDRTGLPVPWSERFLVANPILGAIQSIAALRDQEDPAHLWLTREEDLLTSDDGNFRPVAIHFGPDGCLYVVDWYNPIISHNEVPRDHPDRDKSRSRIWRIRHRSQSTARPVNVAAASNSQLLELLDSNSTWVSRAAWHQIVERKASGLAGRLRSLARDPEARVPARLLALWSLDELGAASARLAAELLRDSSYAIRREAARFSADLGLAPRELADLLGPLADEDDGRVRLAAIEALASQETLDERGALLLLRFLRSAPQGRTVRAEQVGAEVATGRAAEIALERCLVRAALERREAALTALLDSRQAAALDPETRLFAALCLGGSAGAERLAAGLSEVSRGPTSEELAYLGRNASRETLQATLSRWIAQPQSRAEGLRTLLASLDRWDAAELAPQVAGALRALVADDPSREHRALLLQLARRLRLVELEEDVTALLADGQADRLECLRTLIEIGSSDAGRFFDLAGASVPGGEFRRLAVAALAGVPGPEAFELLLELWPDLAAGERRAALAALLTRREGAQRLADALGADALAAGALDGAAWARLDEQLPGDERLAALRARAGAQALPGLHLSGGGEDWAATGLRLAGPFTLEAWVQLDTGVTNADGLLGSPGAFDLNFHDARPRLWVPAQGGDVIIASRPVEPERWFHLALTRDAADELALYLDGELDQRSSRPVPGVFEDLDVGRSHPSVGTAGRIAELRVWDVARSPAQIGAAFRLRLPPTGGPDGPRLVLPSADVALHGAARVEPLFDGPPLQTPAEAQAEGARIDAYRALADSGGDPARGREVFQANCAVCHLVGGQGTSLGPVLDGVARKGREGLLRAILTPNAGVEAGYRTLVVRTRAGELLTGFLAGEDATSILLRRQDREDLRIPRAEIESLRFDALSLMPEGLLDALSPGQVGDLFGYLQSLR